jgi:gliding motility-associated-like protein
LKQIYVTFLLLFTIFITSSLKGQEVTLYEQFNGRYDFTFIGNTLNYSENGTFVFCGIRTEATANLQLQPDDTIEKAYLYWAGSGSGDFNVKLNDVEITAERNSNVIQSSSGLPFFSAFKDVTDQVLTTGNGDYTVSELDVSAILPLYCPNATNFAGWALLIVYKNDSLPLNQLNIYDGLEYIGGGKFDLSIQLTNLNVIDNQDAKIGFIAWEGDSGIAVDETLQINGNQLSNALNPWNNAFNGTNSITNSTELYNMDLDIYNIENNIQIGDETAEIKMTSGQDFVMINAIVTKLNSQLPDATIIIDEVITSCNSRAINIQYTVRNYNATEILPSGTPIAIYCNGEFLAYAETINPIAINESYSDHILVVVPEIYGDTLEITIVVDDLGNGLGIVTEIIETNNTAITSIILHRSPSFNSLEPITICTTGFNRGVFDFSHYEELVKVNPTDTVLFFETIEDALNGANAITNTTHFETITPKEIFITVTNATCGQVVTSFTLLSKKCPPLVYNFISANEDSYNDSFHIVGLKDVFPNHEIHIYNRWGVFLWKGNNTSENWKGEAHYGLRINGKIVPDGTYYYVIYLNDPEYPAPLVGFLYITH